MAVKQEVRRIAEDLPEDATWDDVMEQVYVIQAIEAVLKANKEGRRRTDDEVRKSYGLPSV
jgi:hypothetical protein